MNISISFLFQDNSFVYKQIQPEGYIMITNRWTPYKFLNGQVAKNRVVVPPMTSQTADEDGFVTDRTLEHYRRLSQSQAGMIFVEYSHVHPSGKGEVHQLGAYSDQHTQGLKKLAHVIHQSGAIAGLQIVHAGGKADSKITGQSLLGASSVSVPVKGWTPEVPMEMSLKDIPTYIQWYIEAAQRVRVAGFDLVEIHAAHGYGLNQWLSPITNHRTDEYGGPPENRQRLLLEIVHGIKTQIPEILISVRIPGQDHFPNGLSIEDMKIVAAHLELAGADLIHVSSGIGGWRRPEGRNGEGYLVSDAEQIKRSISLPVIGVGGIVFGSTIDQMLLQEKLDFAGVGRAILQDSEGWGQGQMMPNELEEAI